jgi:hypothetical protein
MGRKRIELFGEDRNKRAGWLTLGNSLSNSNFVLEKYNSYFQGDLCYPQVQGYEGGRYVGCSEEIEGLRPRSPPRQPNMNPLIFTPVNSGISSLPLTPQNSGNLNMNNINLGNNLNPIIPMNFPFVGNQIPNQIPNQIQNQLQNQMQNQMQNIANIQRNNINNMTTQNPY